MIWMTNDHDLAIPVIGWQLQRGVTAQKPITNDDSLKMRHIVQPGLYCGGNIFLNITTLISPFVYNPNKLRGGYYSSPNIITICLRTLSASIKQMKWNFCIAVHFFCYCLFSIFEWKRLKHKQTCPPLLLPSTLVPFPCCNKSGCKWMGHEEYNSAVQTREQ